MIRRAILLVVAPIVFGYALGYGLTGCKLAGDVNTAHAEAEKDAAKLRECRSEARSAYYVALRSVEESLAVYEACKRRQGLQ